MTSPNPMPNQTTPSASPSADAPRAYDIDAGTIRRVDWQELIPATLFFRAFSATFKSTFLIFAALLFTAAFMAGPLGAHTYKDLGDARFTQALKNAFVRLNEPASFAFVHTASSAHEATITAPAPYNRLLNCAFRYPERLIAPDPQHTGEVGFPGFLAFHLKDFACWIVWVFVALAIARTAAVRLATTSRSSTFASFKFAGRRFLSALAPVAVVAVLNGCVFLCKIVAENTGAVGSALAPIVMLVMLGLQVLIAIMVFAAPMCVAAVAAENCDGFDAISHGVSYLLQRPLFLIMYGGLAFLLTWVGSFCVAAVSLSAHTLYNHALRSNEYVDLFDALLLNLPLAYAHISAVVYACAIYILLRRSVDGTPFDSCALNLTNRAPKQLRKILKDAKGAPTFDAQQTTGEAKAPESSQPDA